jgi:DNA repair exonuclease SbcCD ATPase subunit
MTEKKAPTRRVSASNTKQEMLEAVSDLQKQLEDRREQEQKPEEKIAQKSLKQVIAVADGLSGEGIARLAGDLKSEVGRTLGLLVERLEQEVGKYDAVKKAIEAKERELAEIYEIQKCASSLTALLDLQATRKEEFEAEMVRRKAEQETELAERKESLTREIQTLRSEWDAEKQRHQAEVKERTIEETKKREREEEEYRYALNRERQLDRDRYEAEKARLEAELARCDQEIRSRKEQADRELAEREQAVARQEQESAELRAKVERFPKELESAVAREVKEALVRAELEAKYKTQLLQKEAEGEKNVLTTRIASLEQSAREQSDQIAKLSQQLEKSYLQVQNIAVKAVEGSSSRPVASVPQSVSEPVKA